MVVFTVINTNPTEAAHLSLLLTKYINIGQDHHGRQIHLPTLLIVVVPNITHIKLGEDANTNQPIKMHNTGAGRSSPNCQVSGLHNPHKALGLFLDLVP